VFDASYWDGDAQVEVNLVGWADSYQDFELWRSTKPPTSISFAPGKDGLYLRYPHFLGGIGSTAYVTSIGSKPCMPGDAADVIGGVICYQGQAAGLIEYQVEFDSLTDSVVPFICSEDEERHAV
jgi:hypothetical protein